MPAGIHNGSGKVFGFAMKIELITAGELAPDFELEDVGGTIVHLSDYRGRKSIVLAFLRGFM